MKMKKEQKEKIFDVIDEYMELKHESYTIQAPKGQKLKVFSALMDAHAGFTGLRDDVYCINGITKHKLDKEKIKYKLIRG